MNYLLRVASFHDLLVYRKARALQREIFESSKGFPKEETFALTNQIRRSSRAIGANIAKVWAKRRYERHFISTLTDTDGEQMETRHFRCPSDCSTDLLSSLFYCPTEFWRVYDCHNRTGHTMG